jgi:WD40 repeat protein
VADNANHLIVAMGPAANNSYTPTGPWQLAVYNVSSAGALSTSSTSQNMTTLNVGDNVNWYAFSPDFKYLAVAGAAGVEVLAWDSSTLTFTAVGSVQNSGDTFYDLAWDASDHLYATANTSGLLCVYTVTSSGVTAVSGSPYTVANAQSVVTVAPGSSN